MFSGLSKPRVCCSPAAQRFSDPSDEQTVLTKEPLKEQLTMDWTTKLKVTLMPSLHFICFSFTKLHTQRQKQKFVAPYHWMMVIGTFLLLNLPLFHCESFNCSLRPCVLYIYRHIHHFNSLFTSRCLEAEQVSGLFWFCQNAWESFV